MVVVVVVVVAVVVGLVVVMVALTGLGPSLFACSRYWPPCCAWEPHRPAIMVLREKVVLVVVGRGAGAWC